MPAEVTYPGVTVDLIGRSGNALAIIGAVTAQLRSKVSKEAADRFAHEAMDCGSYDELLSYVMRTVDVA